MKIVFFEVEEWEREYLQQELSQHELVFEKDPLTEENAPSHADVDAISVFIYSKVTKGVLDKFVRLKFITTRSTGYDHIDIAFCKEKQITVCNVPEYGTHTVAEHTFALILAFSRMLIPSIERTKKGDFSVKGLTGFQLHKKTIGIVGLGHIGKTVLRIAKGFGMDVIVHTKTVDLELGQQLDFRYWDFDMLLKQSDIVSLHVPYSKETHHLINKENISLMKKGSILINTSRGGLIETEAILKGFDEGILRGVGLDVLEEECQVKEERQLLTSEFLKECNIKTQLLNHVLLTKEQALVTPHNAFNSAEALHKILDITILNITNFSQQAAANVVDK